MDDSPFKLNDYSENKYFSPENVNRISEKRIYFF